jgi:hypothetical protein
MGSLEVRVQARRPLRRRRFSSLPAASRTLATRAARWCVLVSILLLSAMPAGCAGDPPGSADGERDLPATGEAPAALGGTCVTVRRGQAGDVADAFLSGDSPGWAAGGEASMYTGLSGGGNENRGLVRFDLSLLPPGATVTSATGSLHVGWTATDGLIEAHRVLSPWDEATVRESTFGQAENFDPAIADTFSTGSGGPKTFDLTALAAGWVDGTIPNHGIVLTEALVAGHLIWTSEAGAVANRPGLLICYETCEPDCGPDLCAGVTCTAEDACHNVGVCDPATGLCTSPDAANGTPCDDGDACTQTDTCQAGACAGANPVACAASDPCHVAGTCDPATGLCTDPPATDGTACNDGNVCTTNDQCQAGACAGAGPATCDCVEIRRGGPGDIHDAWLSGDFPTWATGSEPGLSTGLSGGGNLHRSLLAADLAGTLPPGSVVTAATLTVVASYNESFTNVAVHRVTQPWSEATVTGASFGPDGIDPVPAATSPAGGAGPKQVDLTPLVAGWYDGSIPNHGVMLREPAPGAHLFWSSEAGAASRPSLTVCYSDACAAVVCTAPDPCQVPGVCDPATGACSAPTLAPNGTACDDADACTQTDTCQAGACAGSNPVVCADADQCQGAGTCDPATGLCSNPPVADGTPCNDGLGCAVLDTCQAGLCSPGVPVICDDGDACTADWCSDATGCNHIPLGTVVASVTPESGTTGVPLTLHGCGFGLVPGQVLVGGVETVIESWSEDTIVVTVLEGFAPGNYPVEVLPAAGGSATGSYTIVPWIKGKSQIQVPPGHPVTLAGDGFSDVLSVTVGGVPASWAGASWPSDLIFLLVPPGLAGGYHGIVVHTASGSSNSAGLFVRGSGHWIQDQLPTGRTNHSMVWTGSEVLTWGGPGLDRTGQRYSLRDTWMPMSQVGAPAGGYGHSGVWSGSHLLVWGGQGYAWGTNEGGRYDPVTDTWSPMSLAGAPSPRMLHTAVWTGTEMIVWGGQVQGGVTATGARYNPLTDVWTPVSTAGAPAARGRHTAVWTGTEMIVWGGLGSTWDYLSTGGRYNPATDTWVPLGGTPPEGREAHTAVWTGTEMVVWGGLLPNGFTATGARYHPATDTWTPTSTAGAPAARIRHAAAWTGRAMMIWGGSEVGGGTTGSGALYDPVTDTWQSTTHTNAPVSRVDVKMVWTGAEAIVWGGREGSSRPTRGGRYRPDLDLWVPIGMPSVPRDRLGASVLWTGFEVFVWGGSSSFAESTGALFVPSGSAWSSIGVDGRAVRAPPAHRGVDGHLGPHLGRQGDHDPGRWCHVHARRRHLVSRQRHLGSVAVVQCAQRSRGARGCLERLGDDRLGRPDRRRRLPQHRREAQPGDRRVDPSPDSERSRWPRSPARRLDRDRDDRMGRHRGRHERLRNGRPLRPCHECVDRDLRGRRPGGAPGAYGRLDGHPDDRMGRVRRWLSTPGHGGQLRPRHEHLGRPLHLRGTGAARHAWSGLDGNEDVDFRRRRHLRAEPRHGRALRSAHRYVDTPAGGLRAPAVLEPRSRLGGDRGVLLRWQSQRGTCGVPGTLPAVAGPRRASIQRPCPSAGPRASAGSRGWWRSGRGGRPLRALADAPARL